MKVTVRELNAAMNAAKKAGGLQWLVDECGVLIKHCLDEGWQEIDLEYTSLSRNIKKLAEHEKERVRVVKERVRVVRSRKEIR